MKQKNADKIRSMSDEELSDFLHNISTYVEPDENDEPESYISVIFDGNETDTVIRDNYGDILEWLREDAE